MDDSRIKRPENGVLEKLPEAEYQRLKPHLEPQTLKQGQPLHRSSKPLSGVYFLTDGVASLIIRDSLESCLELSIVGNESTVGERAIFAHDLRTIESSMLTDGSGFMVAPDVFRDEFYRFGAFHDLILNNLEARIIETSQTALCNRAHPLEKRLVRWLLTVADRLRSETLRIRQEDIAARLHVTRTSISAAASKMRERGLIDYQRGEITIVDRHDCEEIACECYRIIENTRSIYFKPVPTNGSHS